MKSQQTPMPTATNKQPKKATVKKQEDLHPELEAHIRDGWFGQCIHHPLLIEACSLTLRMRFDLGSWLYLSLYQFGIVLQYETNSLK